MDANHQWHPGTRKLERVVEKLMQDDTQLRRISFRSRKNAAFNPGAGGFDP